MLFLVLLPAIPAIWLIARRSPGDALLDVYLPALFLVPTYYVFEIRHFIGFNASDAVIIPIAIATIVKYRRQWRWQRADLWLSLFAIGCGYSMAINYSTGLRAFVQTVISAFCPYIVGKLLIEQEDLRERFLRRAAWLAAIVAFLSIVEFRLGRNLFVIFYSVLFHKGSPNVEQVRGGFERVQGPFQHAIAAGMIFGSIWIFALWQSYVDKRRLGVNEPKFFKLRRSWILMAFSFLGLVMAMSRGPWMGAALAFGISRIGIAKNVRRATAIVLIVIVVLGGATYSYFKVYTSGSTSDAATREQENAIYRRELLSSYIPIAEAGGLFGWGHHAPSVPGLSSVDNHYLVLALDQGLVGLTTFVLLAFESIFSLIRRAPRLKDRVDFGFAIALVAVISGILLTLGTVFLQAQMTPLYYLFIGWSLATWRSGKSSNQTSLLPETMEATSPRIFA